MHISPIDLSILLLKIATIIILGTAAAWFYRREGWKPPLEVQQVSELPQRPQCKNLIHIKITINNISDKEYHVEKIMFFIE